MPRPALAWWPGGRTAQNALRALPVITASTAFSTPPTALRRHIPRVGRDIGVAGAEEWAARLDIPPRNLQVLGGVAEPQFFLGGGARLERAASGRAVRRCASAPATASNRSGRSGCVAPHQVLREQIGSANRCRGVPHLRLPVGFPVEVHMEARTEAEALLLANLGQPNASLAADGRRRCPPASG